MHLWSVAIVISLLTVAKGRPQYSPVAINDINSLPYDSSVDIDLETPSSTPHGSEEVASLQMAPVRTDRTHITAPSNFQMDDICPRPQKQEGDEPAVPYRRPVCCQSWVMKASSKEGKKCWWVVSWETMCGPESMECCQPKPGSGFKKRDTDIGFNCVSIIGLPDFIDPHPPSFKKTNPVHQSCPVPWGASK